jgi:predicted transcriptional regulator
MARKFQAIIIQVTPAMKKRLQEMAEERGISVAAIGRWALEAYLSLPQPSTNGTESATEQAAPQTETAPARER